MSTVGCFDDDPTDPFAKIDMPVGVGKPNKRDDVLVLQGLLLIGLFFYQCIQKNGSIALPLRASGTRGVLQTGRRASKDSNNSSTKTEYGRATEGVQKT